jgi:putative ABC transport system substrate-binding protein
MLDLRRRQFITLLGGAAAWPLASRAQQTDGIRRVGVIVNFAADDPETHSRLTALLHELQSLGWTNGRNIHIDIRSSASEAERIQNYSAELVALRPDVILAVGTPATRALLQTSHAVPIVFVQVVDPVGSGFVESLAHPGGSATGFTNFEFGMSGKWLELLREIAPRVARAGVLRDSGNVAEIGVFGAIQSAAPSLGMELSPIGLGNASEIEHGIVAFARGPDRGLIVAGGALALVHREQIIRLVAQHRLPTVYPDRVFVKEGGLISYGPDRLDQYRRAAGYVDRILKGEKPADLPVQAPTKYELVINLKTAKALGLEIPATVLARADEVIE